MNNLVILNQRVSLYKFLIMFCFSSFFFFWLIAVAVNYVAISEALGVSPSVMAAGVAADNVICALYFIVLFVFASKIPPEASTSTNGMTKPLAPSVNDM